MTGTEYTTITAREHVTPEVEDMIADIATGWPDAYMSDILERAERYTLANGTHPDFGPKESSPAISYLRRVVREARA